MKDSALTRTKAWIHWVKLEKEPNEDRLLMAEDLEKLVAVVEAANKAIKDRYYCGEDLPAALLALEQDCQHGNSKRDLDLKDQWIEICKDCGKTKEENGEWGS